VGEQAELDIGLLQRSLEHGDAVVEYGVQDDELFACVVTRTGVQVKRRLAAWPQVVDAVRSVRFQVETLRHGSAPVQRHLPTLERRIDSHLQRLHGLIWQPLEPLLGKRQRLLIVPLRQLGSVPFAALHDGESGLAERSQIAFAPSARFVLRSLARRPQAAVRVLALGESSRLPHAAREANAVAGLLPQGRAFVGTDATIQNLLANGSSANVIHLACHAQFRTDNPVFSALHLHDGVLTAEAIEGLRLPGSTIVLSGCETALSDAGSGDEMFGLTRAFLVAGASRVMAALWPVDDATTADLMFDFYAGLRRGQPPGAALRQAQLAARQRRAHPFYWASFSLMGRW
jgi:CHAT domain-containing protein